MTVKISMNQRPVDQIPLPVKWLLAPVFTLMQIVNTAAMGVIFTVSTVLALAQKLLSWVPGYTALINAGYDLYHDLVQLLADRWLKDPRDEPILAAVIGLTLTATPIFIAQLWLNEINYYLVFAFYSFIYGPNISGFVRSFSAMHQDGHLKGGALKGNSLFEKWTGSSFVYSYLAVARGIIPHAVAHGQQHHRENTSLQDVYSTSDYDHSSVWDFMRYMVKEVMYQQFMITPYLYFKKINYKEQARNMIAGNFVYMTLFSLLTWYNWQIALLYMALPWFATNFLMGVIHWTQHTFYGGQKDEKNYLYNTTTILETPVNFLNEGYHACHHHWKCRHWSEAPALFDDIQGEMKANESIVLKDLSSMDLFLLLMLKRFDAMAKKLVWWEEISHQEKVAILKHRVKPVKFSPAQVNGEKYSEVA